MKNKIGLIFPANKAGKPIITVLVKDYNIEINILKASIIQGQTGQMILELSGAENDVKNPKPKTPVKAIAPDIGILTTISMNNKAIPAIPAANALISPPF